MLNGMSATQPQPPYAPSQPPFGQPSSQLPHPSLATSVTPEQRDRAVTWLQQAYAEDRIGESELDWRLGRVLEAANRRELNEAFYGIVSVPFASQAVGLHPAYQPLVRPEVRQQAGRGAAGFAHFSVFLLWVVGPLLVFGLSQPGTYARREAAKAFNFQLLSFFLFIAGGITAAIFPGDGFDPILGFMALGWFILTIVGGAKALQGEDWRNPVTRVLKLQVLSEK